MGIGIYSPFQKKCISLDNLVISSNHPIKKYTYKEALFRLFEYEFLTKDLPPSTWSNPESKGIIQVGDWEDGRYFVFYKSRAWEIVSAAKTLGMKHFEVIVGKIEHD